MARRRYRRRRRPRYDNTWLGKTGRFINKYSPAIGTVANIAKQVGFLTSIVNAEKKFFDTTSTVNPTSGGQTIHLTNLIQGTGTSNREGSSMKLASIQLRLQATINSLSSFTFLRVMLFVDKGYEDQQNTIPGLTEVLQTSSTVSALNMSNSKRFLVLYDRLFNMDNNWKDSITMNTFKKYSGHVRWDTSGASNLTNLREGHIYLLLLSNEATNTPTVTYFTRARFYDN